MIVARRCSRVSCRSVPDSLMMCVLFVYIFVLADWWLCLSVIMCWNSVRLFGWACCECLANMCRFSVVFSMVLYFWNTL